MRTPLTMDSLRQVAPSIFASSGGAGYVSEHYRHIATAEVVSGLMGEGFIPTLASQQRTRTEAKIGFQKHMIRFSHKDFLASKDDDYEYNPEIVLVNSHDRSSAYHLYFGIFRLVCSNGLIVMSQGIEHLTVRHQGTIVDNVINASYKLIENIPLVQERIHQFKSVMLSEGEKMQFAAHSAIAKWGDRAVVSPDQLLATRRTDDQKSNLWSVFNVVQENLMKGGIEYTIDATPIHRERKATTRAIKGINETVSLNQKLWELAEQYNRAA